MRNANFYFGVLILICLIVVMWLAMPGTVKDFKYVTLSDLILHPKILPNFLILLGLVWIATWFLIPQNIKKLRIEPIMKLRAGKHFIGIVAVILGIAAQFNALIYPEAVRQFQSVRPGNLIIIVILILFWILLMVYGGLPNDYKKGIMIVLSITIIILTVLQVLTYFIVL